VDAPDAHRSGLFDGPGEMRERYRSTDWSSTAVGRSDDWPPLLQVMVEVCLSSAFPMVVSWGPDVALLYNDAYVPLLGAGLHPHALGRPAREVWPDAWAVSGPFVDEVMGRGMAVRRDDMQMVLERNGYPEECYFTFSHSPIRNPDGSTGGMFTVAAETTGHILHQRRLRVVQQLGALSTTHAGNPVETCQAATDVLGGARESVPFGAILLRDGDGPTARRVASYGLSVDGVVHTLTNPAVDDLPIVDRVLAGGGPEVITGLRDRYADAFGAGPLGPLQPDEAMVIPLVTAGNPLPTGVLVLGVNPYRPLDEPGREFLALVGRQLSIAVADTFAYQRERDRGQTLADLDQIKTEFFQNVSHELRTPLTLLLAPLEDVLADPAVVLPDAERANITAALRAARRLQRMVDALLDFSRVASGTLVPALEESDVAALTADVASMFRSTAERGGVQFVVQIPGDPVPAEVDPSMWSTIVNNLVSNAVKYTPAGTVSVVVTPRPGGFVELTVTDTGVGIDLDEQQRVFERFHRADAADSRSGAGIGLALVADLVAAHDGKLELVSRPGRGSAFTVIVPRASGSVVPQQFSMPTAAPAAATAAGRPPVADRSATAGVTPATAAGTESPGTESRRLLLVEDDPDLRAYLTSLLASDGWTVDAVGDAEAALAAAFDPDPLSAPDVVLSDILLPGRTGLELLTVLRNAERTARVPIILLTARAGTDAAIEGLSSGADDYITKPFSSLELLARVRVHHELNQLRENAVGQAETRVQQLRTALDSNRVIGTAMGILMAAFELTAAQAFHLMVKASQNTNRKLRDLANDVIRTGTLPFPSAVAAELIAVITRTVDAPSPRQG